MSLLRKMSWKHIRLSSAFTLQASREEPMMLRNTSQQQQAEEDDDDEEPETEEPSRPAGETESEAATELDVQSQTSDDTNVVSDVLMCSMLFSPAWKYCYYASFVLVFIEVLVYVVVLRSFLLLANLWFNPSLQSIPYMSGFDVRLSCLFLNLLIWSMHRFLHSDTRHSKKWNKYHIW